MAEVAKADRIADLSFAGVEIDEVSIMEGKGCLALTGVVGWPVGVFREEVSLCLVSSL